MARIVVLDAEQRSALAATRSLGAAGHDVWTASAEACALASASRYSRRALTCPDPRAGAEQFVEWLGEQIGRYGIDVVLPMTEITSAVIIAKRTDLLPAVVPGPSAEQFLQASDKGALARLACRLDIALPETVFLNPGDDPVALARQIPYPLIIKPARSLFRDGDRWIGTQVHVALNERHLADLFRQTDYLRKWPVLLQQRVVGDGVGIFALYRQGEAIDFFAHRRVREKPPSGGVSVLSESVVPDPAALAGARRLLDYFAWNGVAMVEFKRGLDGVPYLMEINARFWGSLQLAVTAGIDFPMLLVDHALGGTARPPLPYRTGLRNRWLLGDLDQLMIQLRSGDLSLRQRLVALGAFLAPHPFRTRHEIGRWDDLRPFWRELRLYLADLRRIRARHGS